MYAVLQLFCFAIDIGMQRLTTMVSSLVLRRTKEEIGKHMVRAYMYIGHY